SIATGDMDGDGKLDLLEAAEGSFDSSNSVAVLYGNGNGTFSGAAYTRVGTINVNSPALADFNGDNKLDLVLGGYPSTWVLRGNGYGDFSFDDTSYLGVVAESLTVADLNANGKPDLAATQNDTVSVLLGNGDGSFQTARSFPAAGASVAAADVN